MTLFNKTESIIDDYDDDVVYAEFANLAATYKSAPKNELKKEFSRKNNRVTNKGIEALTV